MGRKSLEKKRKTDNIKIDKWVKDLLPKIQNQPLSELTINDLAKLIGKSKSTIYEYFKSKEEIYAHAVKVLINEIRGQIFTGKQQDTSIINQYEYLMNTLCNVLSGISLSFLLELKEHFPNVWKEVDKLIEGLLFLVSQIYKQGMKEELFNTYNIELLLVMDKFFVYQVVTDRSSINKENLNLDEIIRQYMDLRLHGILAKK